MEKISLGIVEKNNQILLIKRKIEEDIYWAFPGGVVEDGENEEQAVEREVLEETNVRCKATKKLGQRIHPVFEKDISYWLCEYISGNEKINSPNEVIEVVWQNKKDAINTLGPTLFKVIKDYLSN